MVKKTHRISSFRSPQSAIRNAFTLIELLVVIAIISLLVSILVPSLQKAKDLAKNVLCQTNLRGMGMAFTFYAEEHGGKWPGIAYSGGSAAYDRWVPRGDPAGYTGNPDFDVADGALFPYTDNRGLYLCPSYSNADDSKLNYSQHQELYGDNDMATHWYRQRSQDVNFYEPLKTPNPETLVNLIDEGGCNDGLFAPSDYGDSLGNKLDWRHDGTLNFLMVDGHFENYEKGDDMVIWDWSGAIWY
ncbi:MAG: type II secretion system protein [Phycisphaerae bacterium]|nr:type II secretion system protein [Phycisphaerae bacterium]